MKRSTGFLLLSAILFIDVTASDKTSYDCIYSTWNKNYLAFSYFPNVYLGTHRNGIGYNCEAVDWFPLSGKKWGLGLTADLNSTYYLDKFGIPGTSYEISPGSMVSIDWGKPSKFGKSKWMRSCPVRHRIGYRYSYFIASDKTSQAYAEYLYEFNISNNKIVLDVGNDDLTFLKTDRFRSAAVDISIFTNKIDYLIGYSVGMKLWHGDYSKQLYLSRTQSYVLEGTYGGNYTLGLLYLSIVYNCFRFSLGYDSEKIRMYFQNGMHKIMNNGMVPHVDRADRMYLEFSIFSNSGQY